MLERRSLVTCALELLECVERFEELSRDGDVVAHVHLPVFFRHGHEGDGDRLVRVQGMRVGTVFDELVRVLALCVGGDVQDACFDAARPKAAPVRLSQA